MRRRLDAPRARSRSWQTRLFALAGMAGVGLAGVVAPVVATSSPASAADPRAAAVASPEPARGLVYRGLALGRRGTSCDGLYEVETAAGGALGCSHGPDPAPVGTDVRHGRDDTRVRAEADSGAAIQRVAATTGGTAQSLLGSIGCIGDGVTGTRVQAIYAVAADRPDRSATVLPAIRASYAPRIDGQFNLSAVETGGEAHVRFVTDPTATGAGCQLSVPVVHLSATGDDSFSNTVSELKALGYNRTDRKYLVWADADVLCGIGALYDDDRPDQSNINNSNRAMYGRVDAACWNYAEAHELMHTLGGVQAGAPHATPNGHCDDEADEMCYDDDGSGPVTMLTVCTGRNEALFDCNHDDYFYAGTPPATNWLATHWNTWNSRWLLQGPLSSVAVTAGGGGGSVGTTSTATSITTTTPQPPPPAPPTGPAPAPTPTVTTGYWMLSADGHVYPFGSAGSFGQPGSLPGGVRAVDLEAAPGGDGYWVLDSRGVVWAYGSAGGHGSIPAGRLAPGESATSLSATPSGNGYWVFTTRGRVVPFGDAPFLGDMAAVALNQPVVGSVATPTGRGYYLFASDGGIFSFGDAAFFGSTGSMRLNRPVTAMAVAGGSDGYWLVGSDGGIFAFGRAGFYGSMGNVRLNRPVSAVVPGAAGYLMVGEDGGAFSFGGVAFFGSLASTAPRSPIVSVALRA